MPRFDRISVAVACALLMAGCAVSPQKPPPPPAGVAAPMKPVLSAQDLYRVGRYFEGQARYERAVTAYRDALARDPLWVDAYTGLGTALAAQRRYDEAIRAFQAAVVLAPQNASLHNNLGYAYLLSGADEEAIRAFEKARALAPDHEKARENLRIAREKAAEKRASIQLVEVAPRTFELVAPVAYVAPPRPARSVRVEVSNGNGVTGLAKRLAVRLGSERVRTVRLTNQRPFNQARTEVQYREGYVDAASALAQRLEHPAALVPSKALAPGVDVRLVLGRDLRAQALERSSRRSRA